MLCLCRFFIFFSPLIYFVCAPIILALTMYHIITLARCRNAVNQLQIKQQQQQQKLNKQCSPNHFCLWSFLSIAFRMRRSLKRNYIFLMLHRTFFFTLSCMCHMSRRRWCTECVCVDEWRSPCGIVKDFSFTIIHSQFRHRFSHALLIRMLSFIHARISYGWCYFDLTSFHWQRSSFRCLAYRSVNFYVHAVFLCVHASKWNRVDLCDHLLPLYTSFFHSTASHIAPVPPIISQRFFRIVKVVWQQQRKKKTKSNTKRVIWTVYVYICYVQCKKAS